MCFLLHSCITFTIPKITDIYYMHKFILFIYLFSAIMSSSNPVSSLLANEKLTDENYIKWKSNLNIVLICEKPKKSSKSKENKNTKTSKKKTPKGTCFQCGEDGHWKRNCRKYLADLKEKSKVNLIYLC